MSLPPPESAAGLSVTRWRKYGHDRLYVQTADGSRLGYWDNKAGTAVLVDQANREAFETALSVYRTGEARAPARTRVEIEPRSENAAPLVSPPVPELDAEVATPVEPVPTVAGTREPLAVVTAEWTDLSGTRAGEAARVQAVALRQAAPVKTFLARVLRVKTDERAWRIGADGEEAVAARLVKLGDAWKILHAIPVGENGADIDHVVIGPGGVFTVNTKHHPDSGIWVGGNTFMVNGARVPYIRNSRFEARRTAKFLAAALADVPVPVVGLIAVMGATNGFRVKSQPPDGDVVVLTRREIATWLSKRPVALTAAQVAAIYAVARRSDTWRS